MRVPGTVVIATIIAAVLGREFDPFDRSLDMHISPLRRKLELCGGRPGQDRGGVGYELVLERDYVAGGLLSVRGLFFKIFVIFWIRRASSLLSRPRSFSTAASLDRPA